MILHGWCFFIFRIDIKRLFAFEHISTHMDAEASQGHMKDDIEEPLFSTKKKDNKIVLVSLGV